MIRHAVPSSSPRRNGRWVALLVAVFALKMAVLAALGGHPLLEPRGDDEPGAYVELGRRVAAGDLAAGTDPLPPSPLYVWFLGAVLAASGGSLAAVRWAQIVLGTAAVALAGRTAERWWGREARWLAAILLAGTGVCTLYEITILPTALDPFLTALALWALSCALQDDRPAAWMGAGASFGALATNRPETLLLVIPAIAMVAFILLVRPDGMRRAAVRSGLLLAGAVLVVIPVTLRNFAVTGEPVLVSPYAGISFHIGNRAEADGAWRPLPGIRPSIEGGREDARRLAERESGTSLRSGEVSAYFARRSLEWIASAPAAAARLYVRKLILVFSQIDLARNTSFTYFARDERTLLGALVVGPWLLVPLGLIGIAERLRRGDRRRELAVWASFVPLFAAALAVFFVTTRGRVPLYVALAIAGGGAAAAIARNVRRREWRDLAWKSLAGAALVAATTIDFGIDSGRATARATMIVRLIEQGMDERAESLLRRTAADHPQPALLHYRAALAWRNRGDLAREIGELERARALEPSSPETALTLGRAYLAAGRPADAVEPLRFAWSRRLEPEVALHGLVAALASTERGEEARELLIRHAVSADAPAHVLGSLANLALDLEAPESAVRYARAAIAAGVDISETRRIAGLGLALLGRNEEAAGEFRRAIELDPGNADAHFDLAVMLAATGRLSEARASVRRSLELRPDDQRALDLLRTLERR
ncbi:MAG TPA: tetratricopeptide repeat protein [Thermoanaerobaculia bacterium]|nr:tetratricopeptide repeat protein [Thermoanaerobaculia bacterium]